MDQGQLLGMAHAYNFMLNLPLQVSEWTIVFDVIINTAMITFLMMESRFHHVQGLADLFLNDGGTRAGIIRVCSVTPAKGPTRDP